MCIRDSAYYECTRDCYLAYFNEAIHDPYFQHGYKRHCVSVPEDKPGVRYFRNSMAYAGFALNNYNLEGVFSRYGGQLASILDEVELVCKRDGVIIVTLDCFEPLEPIWKRHGFITEHHENFDRDLAPANWPYLQLGEPRIAYMHKVMQ